MITREEYLKAKAIVDRYEQDEYEEKHRQAEIDLEEDEDEQKECEFCGRDITFSEFCSRCDDPLSYENCGYG